jgi:hypothetical protein
MDSYCSLHIESSTVFVLFFFSPKHPVRPCGPLSLLFSVYRGSSWGLKRSGLNVDHYLNLTLMLRVSYTCFLALCLRGIDIDDIISLAICDATSTVQYEFDDDVATRVKFEETANYLLPLLSVALMLTVTGELLRK